jgi:ankyrin repeat protein
MPANLVVRMLSSFVDSNEESLKEVNSSGELPLHIACREGECSTVNCILERSDYGASSRNKDGKLPIELLLLCADVDRDCLKYIEAINRLLRADPDVLGCLVANRADLQDEGIPTEVSSSAIKRKHESI